MQKKYSIALGGGAARGFAHIGVMKYLEENNIEIKEIAGTSMGAIIASLFVIGKNTDEMVDFARNINYLKLFDFDLKNGLFKGNKICKILEDIFGDKKIEDQKIKLSIVATNIISGKRKVFREGRIVDAIRASISLPGIFIPYEIENEQYIDGGITCNLPIQVLIGKNIIAVTALKKINGPLIKTRKFLGFTFNRQFLNLNYQVLHRTILIMMKQNEISSLETKNKNIILIDPDFGELDFYSFNKLDEFVKIGYNEIKKQLKKETN